MKTEEAITRITKEIPDFDTYPLQQREVIIAAFKMGWHSKEKHDLILQLSYTGPAQASSKAETNKSWASGPVKERVRG